MSRDDPPAPHGSGGLEVDDGRRKAALLAHLRHELRTPVNAILGYSEMLLEDAEVDAAAAAGARAGGPASSLSRFADDLRRIHAAGGAVLDLINALLAPAAIEERKADLDLPSFGAQVHHDLRTPVTTIVGYCDILLEEAEGVAEAPFVSDVRRIREAAQRLLALTDDLLRLTRIAAGSPEAEAAAGAAASMIQEALTSIRPLAQRGPVEPLGGRVLVVDDNEINRDMLSRRLAREGLTVEAAENGRRALDRLLANPFDLVLLDVMMPEMNGFEVLQRLKDDPALRHIPVIMISALDEVDSVVRCIESGAEDYLPKPFNPVLLRARIGASLEKKRLRDREVLHLRRIEEEKQRADALLHVILPPEIAEELLATNRVRPRRYDDVAVLFCDIVGFTPYCSGRAPEEVVAHLQQLFEAYEGLALRHDLHKVKTIGDSFMTVAGALRPVENPVLASVRCGLEMVATAPRLRAGWQVRVGIHVGPVLAGVVGHRSYLFDLWGDTVNTAARVESHGQNGAVNLSAAAWQRVSSLVNGASQGLVTLKGIGDVEIFRVDGLR